MAMTDLPLEADMTISRAREIARDMFHAALVLLSLLLAASPLSAAQGHRSIPEEIEWTWEVRPSHPDPKLPNVLLLGDSITRSYYPGVVHGLDGRANVYLFATSASVGDPRLPDEIRQFYAVESVRFDVVHFNNGMHGWGYNEEQYKEAFPGFLKVVRSIAPSGRLIWATTTSVKSAASNGASNPRIDARNEIAKAFVSARSIAVDDQHALMSHYYDLHRDSVHFNDTGASIQAAQVVAGVEAALNDLTKGSADGAKVNTRK
ncbi:MAG: hypothetical protein JWQ49_3882 [Edaphobacter sp.]|nr:hypothetical protein [Edaphobacter sp.]